MDIRRRNPLVSSHPVRQWLRGKSPALNFAGDLCLRPIRVLVAHASPHKLATGHAHLESQFETLLKGHGAHDFDLHGFDFRSCIQWRRHAGMVARNTLDGALNDRTTGASVLPNEM